MKTYYQMQNPNSINSVRETSEGMQTPEAIKEEIAKSIEASSNTIRNSFALLEQKAKGIPLNKEVTYYKFPNIDNIKGLFEKAYTELTLIEKMSSKNPTVDLKNQAKVVEGGLKRAQVAIRNDVPLNRESLQFALSMNAEDFYGINGLKLKTGPSTTDSVAA